MKKTRKRKHTDEYNLIRALDPDQEFGSNNLSKSQREMKKHSKRKIKTIFESRIPPTNAQNKAFQLHIPISKLSCMQRLQRKTHMRNAQGEYLETVLPILKCVSCQDKIDLRLALYYMGPKGNLKNRLCTNCINNNPTSTKIGIKRKEHPTKDNPTNDDPTKDNKTQQNDDKRKQPSQRLRDLVWTQYTSFYKTVCYCCNRTEITALNFECGHIISHSNGGLLNRHNLRPICSACNRSMGKRNMHDFQKEHYPEIFHQGGLDNPIKIEPE